MTNNPAQKQIGLNPIKPKLSTDDKIFYVVSYAIVGLLTLIVLYPLVYILSCSFSSANAVSTGQVVLLPVDLSIEGYKRVFENPNVWVGYRNTILYTVLGTLINVSMTMICAYPLARKRLPHRGFFTFLFTFTMLFGGGMIPTYLLMRDLHILNSVWVMVLPGAIGVSQMIVARIHRQHLLKALSVFRSEDGIHQRRIKELHV